MKAEYELLLEFLLYGAELLTRRDAGLILLGERETASGRRLDALLERLRHERLLDRHGLGRRATFTITADGRQRLQPSNPSEQWDRPWDEKWRVFSFDMPSQRKKDRMLLWRALRNHRFGLLQRSVWIWPHETEPILRGIVEANNVPECFCGFEASRVFLCDDAEIVVSAWDFEEISRRHQMYLGHAVATPANLKRARDFGELARLARIERDAFAYAFSLDPLLPRRLWPRTYQGPAIIERRRELRAVLHSRLQKLAET